MNPLLQVFKVSWSQEAATLERIRTEVFIKEQGVPRDIEMDDRDAHCIHILALINETAVGTGRIDLAKEGKVGRVAVLPEYRHQGIGTTIMQGLETIARETNLSQVWLNAQRKAIGFYQGLHYTQVGPEFVEAGIPHCKMVKDLLVEGKP